jgi:hypothetical protein
VLGQRLPLLAYRVILCAAKFGRYPGIADSGKPPVRQIYGLTAYIMIRFDNRVLIDEAARAPIIHGRTAGVSTGMSRARVIK